MRDFRSPEQPAGPPYQASGALVYFRNRSDEIEQCLRGLTNTSGPHFWLVVAPPQVGKTWFLHENGGTLDLGEPVSYLASPARPWSVHLLDIGEVPAADRREVGQLLRRIFGGAATGATDDDELRLIAQQIVRTGERCLRLLDGADLLAVDTSRALRRCLSRIHDIVIETDPQARLAVVVASRRDTEWRGLLDGYPPSVLQLTEFTSDVVLQALGDLAVAMRPDGFPDGVVRQNAERVHKLSEGLPALLVRCLQWIQENEWTSLERLESREVFTDLAEPYIRKDLLAPESLFPLTHGRPQPDTSGPLGAASEALEHAIRNLVTYRLFTQSHLQHHLGDPDLARCMADLNWQVEDLWREISGTALLARPLDEPGSSYRPPSGGCCSASGTPATTSRPRHTARRARSWQAGLRISTARSRSSAWSRALARGGDPEVAALAGVRDRDLRPSAPAEPQPAGLTGLHHCRDPALRGDAHRGGCRATAGGGQRRGAEPARLDHR